MCGEGSRGLLVRIRGQKQASLRALVGEERVSLLENLPWHLIEFLAGSILVVLDRSKHDWPQQRMMKKFALVVG